MNELGKMGVIGGLGFIGSAMIQQMLAHEFVAAEDVFISGRTQKQLPPLLAAWPALHVTQDNAVVVAEAQTIILSVRPHQLNELSLDLSDHTVISVMAGVTTDKIAKLCNAKTIVRAMPNAALVIGKSYTPWFSPELPEDEATNMQRLFECFGTADRLAKEDDLEFFTALTGSGQGWIAFLEQALVKAAINHGVDAALADRAVRQLFYGISDLLKRQQQYSLQSMIQELVDYAGTTAAGLNSMLSSQIEKELEAAMITSYRKAASDMTKA